jgi:uncharacterized oligopeptide transporter (OPT) family protein
MTPRSSTADEATGPTNRPPAAVGPSAQTSGTPPEQIERQWFEQVYRGRGDRMPQLTCRAVIMGSIVGGVLSVTNVYIGFKSGWGFGVAITACILSYTIWTTFYRLGLVRSRLGILENNCLQSTASAAGYSTGGVLISAVAAYMLVTNASLPTGLLMAWVFLLAVLGVTMAIPMKRQMINIEQLRFPSGIAAAETLRALHSEGPQAMQSARALGLSGMLTALSLFASDGLRLVSPRLAHLQLSHWLDRANAALLSPSWIGRTVFIAWDPIFFAAGAISGLRVCASMLIGGIACWVIFAPLLQQAMSARGIVIPSEFRELAPWTLWAGAGCMVSSGLVSFGLQWKSAQRAFAGLARMLRPQGRKRDDLLEAVEVPPSWFLVGQIVATVGLSVLARHAFGMPYWITITAVALSFALALVACRVTGETDTTPVGAMGKITQLTFGALQPGKVTPNLMSACITAGAADSAADLLLDLKSGYLLGANARKQFLAQFAGIFTGTVASVIGFRALVPDASVLATEKFPAPAALQWAAVAQALSYGLSALHPVKIWLLVIGVAVGILLPLLSHFCPRTRRYLPSPAGLGLAWTFPFATALSFFIGAAIAELVRRRWPETCEHYLFPVASGAIAGGGLMGVTLNIWENAPRIWQQLFGAS